MRFGWKLILIPAVMLIAISLSAATGVTFADNGAQVSYLPLNNSEVVEGSSAPQRIGPASTNMDGKPLARDVRASSTAVAWGDTDTPDVDETSTNQVTKPDDRGADGMNWLLFGLIWSLEILVVFGYLGFSSRSKTA